MGIFVALFVPETKGVPIEAIEDELIKKHWFWGKVRKRERAPTRPSTHMRRAAERGRAPAPREQPRRPVRGAHAPRVTRDPAARAFAQVMARTWAAATEADARASINDDDDVSDRDTAVNGGIAKVTLLKERRGKAPGSRSGGSDV